MAFSFYRPFWTSLSATGRLPRGRLVIASLAALSLFAQGSPQSGKSVQDGLQELTSEVRQLRNSLNQSSARHSLVQIEVERYRMEHDTVTLISNRLEDTRTELASVVDSLPQLLKQADSVANQLKAAADPDRRTELEAALNDAQTSAEQHKQNEAQLRERESRLTDALRIEEAKLDAVSRRLDAVAAQLEAQEVAK